VSRVFLKLKHGYVLLSCVLHVRRKTYIWKHALLGLKATTYGFFSTQTSQIKFLHHTATSITPTQTANAALFLCCFPSPQKGGGVGWGRAQQQQQQQTTSATAATAARQGQNKKNTAMTRNRLLACEGAVY